MNATMCPRCGGHLDRCECAELRREGMSAAAALVYREGWVEAAYQIRRALARKPEPL
jgi:hypothetical protein